MKNIKLILTLFVTSLSLFSCREDFTEPGYNGNSYLHFNNGVVKSETVKINTNYKDHTISYGTIKEVTGTHQVNLIVDVANSDAVEGTDFQIIKGTDELTNGETGGNFVIRMIEPPIPNVIKKVVFKIQSSTINNAVFDTTYILNFKLACPIDVFLGTGDFEVTYGLFSGGPYSLEIVLGQEPNTLILKDYIVAGYDIILNYNEDTGEVFYPVDSKGDVIPQETGFVNAGAMIMVRAGTSPSTFDGCSRTLNLNSTYYSSAGSWGNKLDVIKGL